LSIAVHDHPYSGFGPVGTGDDPADVVLADPDRDARGSLGMHIA
jgi:hypothetical protein